jgi:Fur family ferric uptake transcriptional regulator
MDIAQENKVDLMAILEDRGYRSTGSRRYVIDLLSKKRDGFSVGEVTNALPRVGRATVYRTIKLLLDAEVICKLALPNGAPRYTLSRVEHHHHTVCVECGVVGEFRDVTVERMLRTIGRDISGEIVGHRIEVYITCGPCLGMRDQLPAIVPLISSPWGGK